MKLPGLEEILGNANDVIDDLDLYRHIMLISRVIEKPEGYGSHELIGMSVVHS